MPIRRSLLNAFCLLLFGSASAIGQQDDPFAAWDRQKLKSTPARPAQADQKSSVTYFPATAEEETSSETVNDKAATAAQVRMRERSNADGPMSSPAVRASRAANMPLRNAASAQPALAGTAMDRAPARSAPPSKSQNSPSSDLKQPGKSPVLAPGASVQEKETAAAVDSAPEAQARPVGKTQGAPVMRAVLDSSTENSEKSAIVQVRDQNAAQADEENGFVNFLKGSEAQPSASDEDVSFPELSEDTEESEAKAIFGDTSTLKKTTTAPPEFAPATGIHSKEDNGPQSPGVTVQWVRHGEFNVGQECDVELLVQNTSKAMVRSVMAEAVLPEGLEIVEADPAPMQGSDTPTWTFGELRPGETRSVALKAIPRRRGDVRLEAYVRFTGYSASEFSIQEPLIGVSVVGPEEVEVGQQVAYVVRVNNPGTGVASNVIIQAAIPEGLEHRSGSLLSIEIGTLSPGESRQARLNLAAVKGGPHELAVRAIADGGLNEQTMVNVSVAEPKLNIAIGGPTGQLAGRTSDYSLSVSNAGNVQSSNVRAKYRIPQGLEYVSADRGGKYNKTDHSIEWFVGTLQPAESSDFQMTLRATETGEMLHQAGVVSEHGQVTMCEYATTVEGVAALDLKITASNHEMRKGEEVAWTVRISNTGSRPAEKVGMSCELPSGIQLIKAEGPSEYIAENGVMVFRSLPVIEAGESVEFTVTAQCIREGNHRLRLRVASESISEPLIGEESATVSER